MKVRKTVKRNPNFIRIFRSVVMKTTAAKMKAIAELLRDTVKLAIEEQRFKWPPLKEGYRNWKIDHGLDGRILIATGEYLNSIDIIRDVTTENGVTYSVGVTGTHEGGLDMVLLARMLEFGCFPGDTMVSLVNGTEVPIKYLCNKDPLWVYSCTPDGTIVVAKGKAYKTRSNVVLISVRLDNGAEIKCTPDHPFMLKDGTYLSAQELIVGQSLMPLYRRSSTIDDDGMIVGYEMYLDNKESKWKFTHRKSSELIARSSRTTVRHHEDYDKRNNSPENLMWLTWIEHQKLSGRYPRTERHKDICRTLAKNNLVPWTKSAEGRISASITGKKNITEYNKNLSLEKRKEHAIRYLNPYTKSEDNRIRASNFLSSFLSSEKGRLAQKNRLNKIVNKSCPFCSFIYEKQSSYNAHVWQCSQNPNRDDQKIAKCRSGINHKVTGVSSLGIKADVYCLEVPVYGNFALSAGVFVHNTRSSPPREHWRPAWSMILAKLPMTTKELRSEIIRELKDKVKVKDIEKLQILTV